uniref:Mediator of RNA polymerase II transcription subunit 22 n=1 Tax=Rhabditophanes sp. KR3021 TaxID=114890 RepID=A0AC35TW18_9BILA
MQHSSATKPNATAKTTNKSHANKAMTIQDYKGRLKDNIKSINDNVAQILNCAKTSGPEESVANNTNKFAEYYTTRNEAATRAALILKSADELLRLTQDIKEFLVLRDFSFLTQTVKEAEQRCKTETDGVLVNYDNNVSAINGMIDDIDEEISQNFNLLY